MHCCLWFRSVFRVRGPWPKRYGYHLSIIIIKSEHVRTGIITFCPLYQEFYYLMYSWDCEICSQ